MKQNTWGDLANQGSLFNDDDGNPGLFVDFSDTGDEPIVSRPIPIDQYDGVCLQLVSGGARTIALLAGDNVVAGTHTWTIKAGNFGPNDVGGTILVADAANANNQNAATIVSVTNAYTVVTSGTQTNETFTALMSASLVQASPFGAWSFRVSNTYSSGTPTRAVNDGSPWTPITDQFVPVPDAVSEQYVVDTANSANQFLQAAPFLPAAFQVVFTPSAGAGPIYGFGFGKGNH